MLLLVITTNKSLWQRKYFFKWKVYENWFKELNKKEDQTIYFLTLNNLVDRKGECIDTKWKFDDSFSEEHQKDLMKKVDSAKILNKEKIER